MNSFIRSIINDPSIFQLMRFFCSTYLRQDIPNGRGGGAVNVSIYQYINPDDSSTALPARMWSSPIMGLVSPGLARARSLLRRCDSAGHQSPVSWVFRCDAIRKKIEKRCDCSYSTGWRKTLFTATGDVACGASESSVSLLAVHACAPTGMCYVA
jgi:hypothetical protein